MADARAFIEFPFTTGQNEGVDRSVLPVPQFSSLRNARYNKSHRLGKRNGYTSVSSLDVSAAPLGNGTGALACLGPSFCVVDDRFYRRDFVANAWQGPPQSFETGIIAGTRLYGKFPQFMPAPIIDVLNVQSDLNTGGIAGTANASIGGMTVALGYVWTCASFYSVPDTTWMIRVWATDPSDGQTVFQRDIDPGGAGTAPATVTQYPVLLSTTSGIVVLIYDRFTAGVKDSVAVRTLTSIAGGFGGENTFACIESAANYDPTVPGGILFVYVLTGSPTQYTITRMNPVTMIATVSTARISAGNKTKLSCFCNSAGLVWVGYTDAGVLVDGFDASLVRQGGSANINALFAPNGAQGPVMFATRTAATVAAITQSVAINGTNVLDLDNTATSVAGAITQYNATPLSQPFAIGAQIFIWVRHIADSQLGVATLVRIPISTEYLNNSFVSAFPVEATIDDRDIDSPPGPTSSGPALVTPQASSMGYVTLLQPTRESIVAGTPLLLRRFVLVPVRHRSEGVRYSPSQITPVAGKQFVAAAQPMWVDAGGEYEAGFIQAPVSTAATIITGGGNLTASSNYAHTAVYVSIDANGQTERSAPAVPRTCATTANKTATVEFSNLELGMRWVRCEIYRTLANGSVFYLVGSVDASPAMAVNPTFTFVDTYADLGIIQNGPLYTQVGQELATSQFPACSFATTGNSRMLCAGGFNSNVGHFSKQFTPHICPEFCDDDAFRVTLESEWTGAAYCDNWVAFTRNAIHVITGDGPDGSGSGFFSPANRLPYALGCIDWRSVAASDIGVFFQSGRGLELLPRGFGAPVLMDQVQDTIAAYPIITSARAYYSSDDGRQLVRWTATATEGALTGVVIVYDLMYKTFAVDTYGADGPACFQAEWSGEPVLSPSSTLIGSGGASKWHPFRVQDSSFDDQELPIAMSWETGDVRPWGTMGHGVVNRLGLFARLKSACALNVTKTTDHGTRAADPRVYDGITPATGTDVYLEVTLGSTEQKEITALRVAASESSTTEGLEFIGMIIEHNEEHPLFRNLGVADRTG